MEAPDGAKDAEGRGAAENGSGAKKGQDSGASGPAMALCGRFDEIVANLAPGWRELLDEKLLKAALREIDELGDGARTAPPAPLILEMLRYAAPAETVFVVMGQDPYPAPGDATGLCFSTGARGSVPDSLRNIFACLRAGGLMREDSDLTGDLTSWALQGGLLLNRALTTRVGARNAHSKIWKKFTSSLLVKACEARRNVQGCCPLVVLLWGREAQGLAASVRLAGAEAREWSHPSPLSDNKQPPERKFAACGDFLYINGLLRGHKSRPICWGPLAESFAFCDGACSGNGQIDAVASFGATWAGGACGGGRLCGRVEETAYALVDPSCPLRGFRALAGTKKPATNNRGEYLGMCWALYGLLVCGTCGTAEVVSDSMLCVKTLTEWLPARRRKGTAHELENLDLVEIAEALLSALRARAASVTLTHVRSHQRAPTNGQSREFFLWKGNSAADGLAASGAAGGPRHFACTGPPVFVRRILAGRGGQDSCPDPVLSTACTSGERPIAQP
jgi:uracil-DNA glycosylase